MQQATHPRISVHTAHDAHVVFEAVRQRRLPAITRRLNDAERSSLVASGAVFVWVESEDDQGLRRWTGAYLPSFLPSLPFLTGITSVRWPCVGAKQNAGGWSLIWTCVTSPDESLTAISFLR